jgi:hypothetical protein
MDSSQQNFLTFSSAPWLVAVSICTLAIAIALSYWNWRRSKYRSDVLGLESLRCIIIAAIVLLLNQPEWTQEFRPTERPRLVVLVDRSKSMETQDVVKTSANSSEGKRAISRIDATQPLLNADTWESLSQRFQIDIRQFPESNQPTQGSDLHAALESAIDAINRTQAVVLASDGDWTTGSAPVNAAMKYRAMGIPIFTIPIGSSSRLPDLEMLSLDVPTFGIAGKSLRIPFTIESSFPRDHVATVTVVASDGEKMTQEVRIAAMGRTSDSVVWLPKEAGDYTIKVELPQHPEELLQSNNTLSAPIAIRQEKLKVLIVETYPRWEYRYLRNALSRDPGVEVSCLLLHPELSKVGGGNRDYLKEFPNSQEELSKYDVVFLGDIGVGANQLTEEQCKLIKGLVEFQASGLVFLPGPQGNQLSLSDTEIDALIPVVVDANAPTGYGQRDAMHFELTESGRRSLLTKLADTEDENLNVWSTLPGFQWHAPVIRAKAGTETLSVHQETSNEYGRLPMIVTKTFGAGKVLFMATDGAWRWRKGVEDKYHYRFWGQVVRWMAYQRNMAKGESIRFYYSPDQPNVGQAIALKANVMSNSGEPLTNGEVTAKVEAPSGKVEVVRLQSAGAESWGLFEGRYPTKEPGLHQVVIASRETGGKLDASFFVQGTSQERVGLAAKPKILEELSKVSRGETVLVDRLSTLMQLVGQVPDPPSMVKRWQLWAHPWMMTVLATLLTVFWIGRKWIGML